MTEDKSPGPLSRDMPIVNQKGVHARPASLFAKRASRFDCEIEVSLGDNRASGTNVMELLSLGAAQGTTLHVTATGPDAEEALDELAALVSDEFDFD